VELIERIVLIYKIGYQSIEVSIFKIKPYSAIEILYTTYINDFGGFAFDNKLVEYFIQEFKLLSNIDISNNSIALTKLKIKVKIIKEELSTKDEVKVILDNLVEG